jgi:redox-sensitive bicupin YhaK (pirin superfamily)
MLDGHMLHEDHMGNRGDLRPGDVQWMTAGRGIIHSEMPQQQAGRMRGFQLWLNLAAKDKLKPAAYRDIPASDMPWQELANGHRIKLIAGTLTIDGQPLRGPIAAPVTEPIYADIALAADVSLEVPLPASHNAFVYVFEGSAEIAGHPVRTHAAALLGEGEQLSLHGGNDGARLLLLAGKPLDEPIAQYGPFVMNTDAEIEQALRDYRDGSLTG